jgi:hypothetical protein
MHKFTRVSVFASQFSANPMAPVSCLDYVLLVTEPLHQDIEDSGIIL